MHKPAGMAADCSSASVSSRPEGQHQGTGIFVEPEMCKHSSMYEGDPVSQPDEFNMYHYKVQICPKGCTPSNWGKCGYAHHGEKARRRDPRMGYTSVACPDMLKSGKCPRGDACGMAHSAFEFWLHPQRYRTERCKDGDSCPRAVCFFAHSQAQLRKAGYPTTDSEGNPLPRPKFSLSGLRMQQPQAAAAVASTAAANQPIQQVARQASCSSCSSSSRRGSLDSVCSAVTGAAISKQCLLPSCNRGVSGHHSNGSCEVYPMLPTLSMQGNGNRMSNAACLTSPNAFSRSDSSSPISSSFAYLPPTSTHVQYKGTYSGGTDIIGCGVPAAVGTMLDAHALLPTLVENVSNAQQQAQLAQQAADAANGQLAALYQALGISPNTTDASSSSSNSSSLCMSIRNAVGSAQLLSPSGYGFGYGSDISNGSFSSAQFACYSPPQNTCYAPPHNTEQLLLLNDTGSMPNAVSVMSALPVPSVVQPMTPLRPGSMRTALATQGMPPLVLTTTAAATAASNTAAYVSGLAPQGACAPAGTATAGRSGVLPAQQHLPALQASDVAAMQQQAGWWRHAKQAARTSTAIPTWAWAMGSELLPS